MLNVDHFFDGILQQIAGGLSAGFIHAGYGKLVAQANEPDALWDEIVRVEAVNGVSKTWVPFDIAVRAQSQLAEHVSGSGIAQATP